jgi:hypothetical protein
LIFVLVGFSLRAGESFKGKVWGQLLPETGTRGQKSEGRGQNDIFSWGQIYKRHEDIFGVVPQDFFKKLFTAEPRPGIPRSAVFDLFEGILAARVYQIEVHTLRFLKKVGRNAGICPYDHGENGFKPLIFANQR